MILRWLKIKNTLLDNKYYVTEQPAPVQNGSFRGQQTQITWARYQPIEWKDRWEQYPYKDGSTATFSRYILGGAFYRKYYLQ